MGCLFAPGSARLIVSTKSIRMRMLRSLCLMQTTDGQRDAHAELPAGTDANGITVTRLALRNILAATTVKYPGPSLLKLVAAPFGRMDRGGS